MNRNAQALAAGILVLAAGAALGAEVSFAEKPAFRKAGDGYEITFAASAPTDATVSILGPDGKIVCHYAAGMLGEKAQPPFGKGLRQKLAWDGKTDLGAPAPAGCKVRVSLGLKAEFVWTAPLMGKKGHLSDIGSLTPEEEKAWPKLKTPDGETVLVPKAHCGIVKPSVGRKQDRHGLRYQIAVDPLRDEVYISGGAVCMNSPWRRLDGKTGKWDPEFKVNCHELAVSPENGLLYVRYMTSKKSQDISFWGVHFLKRMDRDRKPVPLKAKFAGPDGEVLLPSDASAKSFGDGMGFSPNGDLYMLCEQRRSPDLSSVGRIGPGLFVFDSEGNPKPLRKYEFPGKAGVIRALDENGKETQDVGWRFHISGGGLGVGADRHGNIYIGTMFRPVGKLYPEDLVGSSGLPPFSDRMRVKDTKASFYQNSIGSVIKLAPEGVKVTDAGEPTHWHWGNPSNLKRFHIEGEQWTYTGLSLVTTSLRTCICPQSRIGVDAYGRTFVPQVHRQAVLVLGPDGNPILRIGRYGAASVKMQGSDVRFAFPGFVAASETALYVVDKTLARVVKVDLVYAAEETASLSTSAAVPPVKARPASEPEPAVESKTTPLPTSTAKPTPVVSTVEQATRGLWSLAMSYKRAGRPDKAREYLRRLVEEYPDTRNAERARQELGRL